MSDNDNTITAPLSAIDELVETRASQKAAAVREAEAKASKENKPGTGSLTPGQAAFAKGIKLPG